MDLRLTDGRHEKTVFVDHYRSGSRSSLAIASRQPREIDGSSSIYRVRPSGSSPSRIWAITMNNLEQMSRVLYRHVWDDVSQWVSALDHLAGLSDTEIAALAAGGRVEHSVPHRCTDGCGKSETHEGSS